MRNVLCCNVSDVCPPVLCFRVKFYATDPLRLKEEITRSADDCHVKALFNVASFLEFLFADHIFLLDYGRPM